MDFIKEYNGYFRKADDLSLPRGIRLSNSERMEINQLIKKELSKFYTVDKSVNRIININGKFINTEYLFKAINNRLLLKKIVFDDRNEIISNICNKQDLFNFIRNNGFDLFNTQGKYFNAVYNLLSSTSMKGKKVENKSFIKFEEVARKKGLNIKVENPTMKEDIGGIDGFFYTNGKRFTIQVKPLFKIEDYNRKPNTYIAFCDGVLKELKTDYLILTNEEDTFIFRSRGIICGPSYFLIPKSNIVQ